MKKLIIVYDDRTKPEYDICDINGGRSFGNTIYKRKRLYDIFAEKILKSEEKLMAPVWLKSDDMDGLERIVAGCEEGNILNVNSACVVSDEQELSVLIKKALYARENYEVVSKGIRVATIYAGKQGEVPSFPKVETNAFTYLGEQSQFINFLTGGFDARFFNSLDGDYYTVTKSSDNVEKIKKEFDFYYLLPDEMKRWFVQPYNYIERDNRASYQMERLHMTDIAIRYVHGAIDGVEMKEIIDQLFEFIDNRCRMTASIERIRQVADRLYVTKVLERIEELEKNEKYPALAKYIESGTAYKSVREIFDKYKALYDRLIDSAQDGGIRGLVVGHGDLCFSNILYQKDAHILRLIDPRGAKEASEIYTDALYDIAKLSHSVCGGYDFFNSGLFEISVDSDMKLNLVIDDGGKSQMAKEIFAAALKERGCDIRLVRLLEASLFLSMLPLHMDNEKKVLGFVLNAINILDEVEGQMS